MTFVACFRVRRRAVAIVALLVFLHTPLLFTSCEKTTDWSKFDTDTVRGSLEVLASAGSEFEAERGANGLAAAVAKAKASLEAQDPVQAVAVSSDSSLTALFKNGMVGCVLNVKDSTRGAAPERVRAAQGGGETYSPYFLLSPFHHEGPGLDPIADIADTLSKFLDPTSATQVYEYCDGEVTVDLVRTAMNASVLYWSGHGGYITVETESVDVAGFLTGEGGTPSQIAARAIELAGKGYKFTTGGGWELFIAYFHDKAWIGILPAFVANYGNFDQFEWMPSARTKSIAYISCCHSWKFRDAFKTAGCDAFFGWTLPVSDEFAFNHDREIFRTLCDTFTVKEAYDKVGNHTDPYNGTTLYWQGDNNVMVRSAGRYRVNDQDVKCHIVQCILDGGVTKVGCNDGLGAVGQVQAEWPGLGTGTFDVSTTEDARLVFAAVGGSTPYIAQKDYVGVSGTITIERYDEGIISGTFCGTLGQWPVGADPEDEPPSATVTIDDGFFKYSGKRIQGR